VARPLTLVLLFFLGCNDPGRDAYERALAHLREGELRAAEAEAERAAADGLVAHSDFLRGNVAFGQATLAEKQARAPGAEPFAIDVAIAYARKARRLWEHAATTRPDWPAARRNVERALLKIDELEKLRRRGDPRRQPQPRPRPGPTPRPEKTDEVEAADERPVLDALGPEEVRRLLDRLAEKEKEKRDLRRSRRAERSAAVERDW